MRSSTGSSLLRTLLITFITLCVVAPTFSLGDPDFSRHQNQHPNHNNNNNNNNRNNQIPTIIAVNIATIQNPQTRELFNRVSIQVNQVNNLGDSFIGTAFTVTNPPVAVATAQGNNNVVTIDRIPTGQYQFTVRSRRTNQVSALTQVITISPPSFQPTQPISIPITPINPIFPPIFPPIVDPNSPIISFIAVSQPFQGQFQVSVSFNAIPGRTYTVLVGPINQLVGTFSPITVTNVQQGIYNVALTDNITGVRSLVSIVLVDPTTSNGIPQTPAQLAAAQAARNGGQIGFGGPVITQLQPFLQNNGAQIISRVYVYFTAPPTSNSFTARSITTAASITGTASPLVLTTLTAGIHQITVTDNLSGLVSAPQQIQVTVSGTGLSVASIDSVDDGVDAEEVADVEGQQETDQLSEISELRPRHHRRSHRHHRRSHHHNGGKLVQLEHRLASLLLQVEVELVALETEELLAEEVPIVPVPAPEPIVPVPAPEPIVPVPQPLPVVHHRKLFQRYPHGLPK